MARALPDERGRIYALELGETAALLVGPLGDRAVERERPARPGTDTLAAGRRSRCSTSGCWGGIGCSTSGRCKPLVEQSPVLARLAREPRGTRIADDRLKNLPMLVGQAPISAYRTLDLPAVPELTVAGARAACAPRRSRPGPASTARDRDGAARFRPDRKPQGPCARTRGRASGNDRGSALAGWLFGASWVADQGPGREPSRSGGPEPAGPGLVGPQRRDARHGELDDWSGDPRDILAILDERRAAGGRIASTRGMDHLRCRPTTRPG